MLDFFRDIGKPVEEKNREILNAYLDGELNAAEARRVEEMLRSDSGLQAEAEALRILKQQLRSLPQRRVPRSFVLDPSVYGVPQRQPLQEAYPLLRTATAFAALLFIFALGLFVTQGALLPGGAQPASEVTMVESAREEAPPAAELRLEEEPAPEAAQATIVEEEALEAAPAESLGLETEDSAEVTVAPEALDLQGPVVAEAERAADETEEAVEAEETPFEEAAAMAAVPSDAEAETEPTPAGSVWLAWAIALLGVVFAMLLALTLVARRQRPF